MQEMSGVSVEEAGSPDGRRMSIKTVTEQTYNSVGYGTLIPHCHSDRLNFKPTFLRGLRTSSIPFPSASFHNPPLSSF